MMRRHFVALAALFVQADPPSLALRVIIFNPHGDDRADPGQRIGHNRDQRAVP
jgi:hypothetical protein